MYLASLVSSDHVEFFHANLPFLAGSALLSILALWYSVATSMRSRVLWFAAGPPLILYSFHNWDLLAVVFLALGIWAWTRDKFFYAALAFGTGAAAKLYPGFVVPALMIDRYRTTQGIREPLKLLLWSALGWGAWNIPVMIATGVVNGDLSGWLGIWQFHSRRLPDFGTFWYWWAEWLVDSPVPTLVGFAAVLGVLGFALRSWWREDRLWSFAFAGGLTALVVGFLIAPQARAGATSQDWKNFVDATSFLLFALGTAGLLFRQWRSGRDPWCTAGAIVALFMLVSKVHSPQYALWLLPFLVVTNVPALLVGVYLVIDVVLYVSGFWWYAVAPHLQPHFWQTIFVVFVYLREIALILILVWLTLKARDVLEGTARLQALSQPSSGRSGPR